MREARTAVLIVVGTGPHSELVVKLNDLTDHLELGEVSGESAALLPYHDEDMLAEVLDAIDGEGWELYVVDSDRSVRHYLATGEEAGYVGQLHAHSKGNIVFETGAYRISRV